MAAGVMTITPDIAREMLADNRCNRPVRYNRVARFARDMADGNWQVNGETVKLSPDGALLDGQHRLLACLQSGASFDTYVIRGLDRDVQATIDTGAARTMGDQLVMRGEKHAMLLAAIIRWYYKWLHGVSFTGSTADEPTHHEMDSLLTADPRLRDAADAAIGYRSQFRFVKPSTWGMAWMLTGASGQGAADVFLKKCATGIDCQEGDPALAFRNRIINGREGSENLNAYEELAYLIQAWNLHRAGRTIGRLGAPKGGWTAKNYPKPK